MYLLPIHGDTPVTNRHLYLRRNPAMTPAARTQWVTPRARHFRRPDPPAPPGLLSPLRPLVGRQSFRLHGTPHHHDAKIRNGSPFDHPQAYGHRRLPFYQPGHIHLNGLHLKRLGSAGDLQEPMQSTYHLAMGKSWPQMHASRGFWKDSGPGSGQVLGAVRIGIASVLNPRALVRKD